MEAVIPLGSKCGWKDYGELKYSLRGLEKYAAVTKVMLLGTIKPTWVKNVKFVKLPDPYKTCKDANIINKVIYASSVWDDFIRSSDDQILIAPFDPRPYYISEVLENYSPDTKWAKRMANTATFFRPKPFYNFDAHVPVRVDSNKFIRAAFSVPYAEGLGCCINSMYFNSLGITLEKIPKNFVVIPDSLNKIKPETHVLNLKDRCLTPELKKWLNNHFPTKSKFEI